MTSSSSGWRASARPPHLLLVLLTALCLVCPALLLAPPARAAAADDTGDDTSVAIADGTVVWGVRASFRQYIGTAGITVSEGLTQNADGEFVFDVADGSYDPDTKALHLGLTGTVAFSAHGGALDMTFRDLEVDIDGEVQAISADVVSMGLDGVLVEYGRVPVAAFDIASVTPTVDATTTRWTDLPSTLTEEAAPAFAGFYPTGAALDLVDIDYTGPGGKPTVTTEKVVASGAPQYEAAGEIDGLTSVSNLVADRQRGVLHVQHVPDGGTGAVLQAYDYTTLAPLPTGTIGAANQGFPGMILDPTTGDVLMVSGSDLVVYRYDASSGYAAATLAVGIGTVRDVAFDKARDRLVALGASGLAVLTRDATAASGLLSTAYTGVAFSDREAVLPVTATSVFTASAGTSRGVRRIVLTTGTQTIAATPVTGVTDPRAKQPGLYDQPTMVFRDAAGFWVSPYSGDKHRIGVVDGAYAGTGDWLGATGGSFLADRMEQDTFSAIMLDFSGRRVRIWNQDGWTDLSVPGLGADSFFNYLGGDIGTDQSVFVASTTGDDRVLKFSLAGIAPTATESPADRTIRLEKDVATQDVQLTAAFADSDSLRWQTRASSSAKWADVSGATTAALTWPATSDDNGRQFRVLATNAYATSTSAVADLTVEFFPRVAAPPDDLTVGTGDDALFKVMPAGHPYPDITWQRKVGGFWQNVDEDDESIAVDGGFLTVLDAGTEQSGTQLRARLSNAVGTTYTRTATLTVAAPSAVRREVSGGTLAWGVKKSFRDYLAGPIAHGSVAVSDGVVQRNDGTFTFPVTGGWSDPAQGAAEVRLGGTVRLTGHDGPPTCAVESSPCLALTISDPVLRLSGTTGELVADVTSKDQTTHELVSYPGVVLAELDAQGWKAVGDRITGGALPATLTGSGAAAFAGFYEAGAGLDPVTLDGILGAEITDPVITPPAAAGKADVALDWRFKRAKVRKGKRAVIVVDPRLVGTAGQPTGQIVVREGGKVLATLRLGAASRVRIRLPRLARGRHFVRLELAGSATQEPVVTAYRKLVVR